MTNGRPAKKRVVLGIAILGLCIFAWIAFGYVRSLMLLGFVDSAIGRMRAVIAAEDQFARSHPKIGFTCTLAQLPRDDQVARLVKDGMDNGYFFNLTGCESAETNKASSTYLLTARPLHSGLPAFCSNQSGILTSDETGSVDKCLSRLGGRPYPG
jgi:hypothetical protein